MVIGTDGTVSVSIPTQASLSSLLNKVTISIKDPKHAKGSKGNNEKFTIQTLNELTPPATPPPEEDEKFRRERLASDILDVIHTYGQHLAPKEGESQAAGWAAKPMFMGRVLKQLEHGKAIRMIMPAFPWKSINKVDKVTGILPDLGEELALARLNKLCEEIRTVYPPGGQIYLATDGLLFDGKHTNHTYLLQSLTMLKMSSASATKIPGRTAKASLRSPKPRDGTRTSSLSE
jgi:SAM-dependent methyltransferase